MTTSTSASARGRTRAASPHGPGRSGDSRAAILAAAQSVLLESGVAGMSIRKVSDRCGFTAPTIYHHFGDKAGLVAAVVEDRFAQVHEIMLAVPHDGDAATYLRRLARAFVGFMLENPEHYRLLSLPEVEPGSVPSAERARGVVKAALQELARDGVLVTEDIEAAYEATWAMLHGVISLRLQRPDYPFSPRMLEVAFQLMHEGLLKNSPAPNRGSSR